MTGPRIHSLNRSDGGVPKRPVAEAAIWADGMDGDRQRNRKYHGGPDRALCLYSYELIRALRGEGHDVDVGSTGENVTVSGLPWAHVVPGARIRLGDEVLVEVTDYAHPCRTIAPWFIQGRSRRISQGAHPGWSRVYARVLKGGVVRVGDRVFGDGPTLEQPKGTTAG